MPPIVLFHDDQGLLAPLTDFRAAFDLRTGALTLRERLHPAAVFAPPALASLAAETPADAPAPLVNRPPDAPSILLVNARAPLPPLDALRAAPPSTALLEHDSNHLVAAHILTTDLERVLAGDLRHLATSSLEGRHLLSRPWHVRSFRDAAIDHDLALLTSRHPPSAPPSGVTSISSRHPLLNLGLILPGAILDATLGPIVVDRDATVRPGAILIGPCYVGPHSTILERATIRLHTAIGPTCKVNGEVGGTIFQALANKAHDGYLGDAFVGEWVNLGAGTTTSNLLNTYAEIITRATPSAKHERTGETFLGPVIGDHVKTAISTRLMTGSILHTGSMFATTAPVAGCIPPFTWATDDPATGRPSFKPYRLDKFTEVMLAAMARRHAKPSNAYLDRLHALHAAAR